MAGMIDMHCHILPGIDDGAKDEKDALELLRAEKEQGISKVVFTPHFNPERISLDKFLDMRKKSYERLKNTEGFSGLGIETKLGAEVYYSMRLIEMDVSGLCFENTNYIMLEFPTNVRPYGITHTVQNLMDRGYTPILAHVERYGYFTNDPIQLYDLVMSGCVAQVNAAAVVSGIVNKGVSALQYIKWEMAHIICSDAHSLEKRPPNTKAAYELVEKKLGKDYTDWLKKNSLDIYRDKLFDIPGVGVKTITGFLAEVGDISRFEDAKAIQKLSGMAIVANQSGKHNGQSSISYRGRKHLRHVLYLGAISVIGRNEQFAEIYNYYLTRKNNPLKKLQAVIAVACKMIRVFYTILTKGISYDGSKMMAGIKRPVGALA